ncbi:MAG: vWA domain-containing protein [Phycisphaerales bacterium]
MSQQAKVRGVADIVFVVDVTGSMAPAINALRENIMVFVDTLSSSDANGGSPVKDWRGRVVGYRDYLADGAGDWLIDNPFVRDAGALKAQLAALEARGGGDEPESLLDALYLIATREASGRSDAEDDRKWRFRGTAARVVIVFTDASYHDRMSVPDAAGGTASDAKNAMIQGKVRLSVFAPELPCYDALSDLPHSELTLIPLNGATPVEALAGFTRDQASFKATLQQLAKSVSQSSYDIPVSD